MDLKQIKAALAVAEYLSFSAAAVELSFSTSAISKQIMSLENELGIRLFERNASSRVSLTPAAEKLLPYFLEINRNYDEINDSVKEIISEKPSLSFSYLNGLSNLGEDRLITAFYNKHPEIAVQQHSELGSSLVKKMVLGKIDACIFMNIENHFSHIVLENQLDPSAFTYEFIEECGLLLAMSSKHPLASSSAVNLEDFRNDTFLFKNYYPLTNMPKSQGIRHFIETCQRLGFTPKIEFTDEQKNSLIFSKALRENIVIPLICKPELDYPGVSILPVKNAESYAEKRLYYLKNNKSPSLAKFIRCVRELNDQR